ncbi:MAG TPA: MBL fold metallo-hydrolase, partial [Chitinophagaceae bacterium]|nr:MBL fold metallo-hydrolase [Chitinophagaceae bacterium]
MALELSRSGFTVGKFLWIPAASTYEGFGGMPTFGSMSLFISSLNSGSNGNCFYIGNDREAILVDAGISCRETEKRMKRLGLSMTKVRAIFVSHEHSDHITGIPALSRKYQVPVYITPGTRLGSNIP